MSSFRRLSQCAFEISRELPQAVHLPRLRELLKAFCDKVSLVPAPDEDGEPFLTEQAGAADLSEALAGSLDERGEPVALENEMCADSCERKQLYACGDEALKLPGHIL